MMNPETISVWADIATIFLVVCTVISTLALGAVYGGAWWYLRKGRKALGLPLLMGQVYALRVQHATMKVTDGVANVPIKVATATTQVKTTVGVLVKSLKHDMGK